MREKAGKKISTKINNPVLKAIESDSYRLDGGIEMGLRYTAYGCPNELFTLLDVVFHQLCRTSVINNTNHRRVILQELGFKELVVVDTDK